MKRTLLAFMAIGVFSLCLYGQVLSEEETDGLLLMREEEKLARDVYGKLYEFWNLSLFSNIAKSEQTHMDRVRTLLDQYGIDDPAENDIPGQFRNEELQELYHNLVEKGRRSVTDALIIGATIEDLDIYDLEKLMGETEIDGIITVYASLRDASINHLNSFNRQLTKQGGEYKAQYISQEYLEKILK